MKTPFSLGVLLAEALAITAFIVIAGSWVLNWPIKQVNPEGTCVRVLVMESRSKQVEKPCAWLTTRFHYTEHVGK